MVTKAYLEELQTRPSPFESLLDRAAAEQSLIDDLAAGITGWDPTILSDNLRRSLALIAEAQYIRDVAVAAAWEAGQMVNATLPQLTAGWGLQRGILPHAGEDAEDYRLRLANSGQGRSQSSRAYYIAAARTFLPAIVDIQMTDYSTGNSMDQKLYPLKASYAALTTEEVASLTLYMNRQETDETEGYLPSAGTEIHIEDVTQTAYTIAVTLHHPAEFSSVGILADARTAIYRWLDENQRIGRGISTWAISRAAGVANVEDVTVTAPAANLAATDGRVYVCPKSETAVVITAMTS